MPSASNAHLSDFILNNLETILQGWEDFARTIEPPALAMDDVALRDHASHMLRAIAADINTPQSANERLEKSKGRGPQKTRDTAAETMPQPVCYLDSQSNNWCLNIAHYEPAYYSSGPPALAKRFRLMAKI